MTVTLKPNQEKAIRAAIRDGQVASVDELIDRAIATLPHHGEPQAAPGGRTVFEQGLGLFGSLDDAALLDEVVDLAYAERRRLSQRKPTL